MNRTMSRWPIVLPALFSCTFGLFASAKAAELGNRPVSWEPRVVVGKYLSSVGDLLVNEQPGQPWRSAGYRGDISSRDQLLALPGVQGTLETAPKAVELSLWGNLPQFSDFSGLESAVVLHDSRAFDLDFTLSRGRVLVTNRKESGAARVWLRIEGAGFQLTLGEPGDCICIALDSYWPRGVPFSLTPKPEDTLVYRLNMQAVNGQVDVKVHGVQHALSAPPGLSYFHWDNINGPDAAPRQRRELETWADPRRKPPASAKPLLEAIAKYQTAVKESDPRTVLFDLLSAARSQAAHDDESQRDQARATTEFAILGLAAISDIDRVMQVLDDPVHAEARRSASFALKHWIGVEAGRDQVLYYFLMERLRYSKAHAATVLQLLHSAYAPDEPETYETLIAYLLHEKLAIRELAWRHLSRLVPENIAVKLKYDPAASPDKRAKAYEAWKEAVPSGSLPARKDK
ncbi:MAG TPA: hypothetical protein VH592_20545 [Gemmataceae bacterium]|jgi:hypothetical protein